MPRLYFCVFCVPRFFSSQWSGPLSNATVSTKSRSKFPNQRDCTRIDRSCRCGRVAQLGEHLLCKQGVTGSIPVTSTNFFTYCKCRYARSAKLCIITTLGIEEKRVHCECYCEGRELAGTRISRPSRSYMVQSSIFKCFNRLKERSLVTKMASAANE